MKCPKGCGWEGEPEEYLHHSCGTTDEKGKNDEMKTKIHQLTPHTLQDDLSIYGKIISVRLLVEPKDQSFFEPVIEIVEKIEEEE